MNDRRNPQPRRVQANHANAVTAANNHQQPISIRSNQQMRQGIQQSSNSRHPSTTNTEVDPSLESSTTDDRCGISVCYSYLIAITSSFLVVLGIYLSLTNFNIRFLLISVLGVSIEAIGACVYCVNNIYTSSQARRKHRVDYDDLILTESGLGIDSTSHINNTNNNNARPVASVTHLLSNQALTSTASTSSNEVAPNDLPTSQVNASAIYNQTESSQSDDRDTQRSTDHLVASTSHGSTHIDLSANQLEQPTNDTFLNVDTHDINDNNNNNNISSDNSNEQLPKSLADSSEGSTNLPTQASGTSITIESSPKLQAQTHNDCSRNQDDGNSPSYDRQPGTSLLSLDSTHHIIHPTCGGDTSVKYSSLYVGTAKQAQPQTSQEGAIETFNPDSRARVVVDLLGETTEPELQLSKLDGQAVLETLNRVIDNSSILATSSHGLVTSGSMDTPLTPKRRSETSQQQRVAHVRRTLVMGLGGEEEMIEIDEDDLDNMSVLPPSYDSIATTGENNLESTGSTNTRIPLVRTSLQHKQT